MNKSIFFLAAVVASTSANAADGEYELRIGGIYSDNIALTPVLQQDETIALIGVGADVSHESKRVLFDFLADLDYQNYADDFYDDEVVGSLNADLDLALVSNLVYWTVQDRFGNLQTDPFQANTRDNRGNVNYFSTGPELRLSLGARTLLELGAKYNKSNFEERPTDNEALTASVSFTRDLSSNRSIFLRATNAQVEYDEQDVNTDFDRRAVSVGFSSSVSRGDISASIGVNEVEIEGEVADGTLATLAFDRELTARTRLNISYDQRFSESGDIFGRFQDGGQGFGETQNIGGLGSPFESRRSGISLNFTGAVTTSYVSFSNTDEDYEEDNPQERTVQAAALGIQRQLGQHWSMGANLGVSKYDYNIVDRKDDNIDTGAFVSRRFGRSLFLKFQYNYFERQSSEGVNDYRENRGSVTLTYAPGS